MPDKVYENHPTLFTDYDAGTVELTDAYLLAPVVIDEPVRQMMVYASVACWIALNGSLKEIYLPAETWTPIGCKVSEFNAKTAAGAGTIYWQGWIK